MLKEYTCIICPNGCDITAEIKDSKILSMEGATCKRGFDYVSQELTNPCRTISSSVLLKNGVLPLVSVRLTMPVPKARIMDVMDALKKMCLMAPVTVGQVVATNILELGSDVIVTKNVEFVCRHES